MNTKIKLALIDDETLILEGLTNLLSQQPPIDIVFSCSNGYNFIRELRELAPNRLPDVILVDIQMEPMDGFELVQRVKDEFPTIDIIILSSHYKNAMFGHMVKLGVAAFLPKNASLNLLMEAISKVHHTGMFFSQHDKETLKVFAKQKSTSRYFNKEELSEREKEVLKLICEEYTNQEIADEIGISKRTVESHRIKIFDKTGVKNVAGLVIYAIYNDIFQPKIKNYM